MRQISIVVAFFSYLLLTIHSYAANALIAIESPAYDFGEAYSEDVVVHEFEIVNKGNTTVRLLGVEPECGCTSASASSDLLQPDETTTVTVVVDLKGMEGRISQSVALKSDAVFEGGVDKLTVQGDVKPSLEMVPSRLDFGLFQSGDRQTKVVKVQSAREDSAVVVKDVHIPEGLPVAARVLPSPEGSVWSEVEVSLSDSFSSGSLSGAIRVHVVEPEEKFLVLTVLGEAWHGVRVVPAEIPVNAARIGTPEEPPLYFRVFPGSGKGKFSIEEIIPSVPLQAEVIPIRANGYLVRLSQLPAPELLAASALTLKTDVPDGETVTIPFRLVTVPVALE